MVGGEHQHQRILVRVMTGDGQRSESDSRRGVTARRFENDVLGQLMQLTQLLRDDKAVLFVTNHHRAFALDAVQTADGGL